MSRVILSPASSVLLPCYGTPSAHLNDGWAASAATSFASPVVRQRCVMAHAALPAVVSPRSAHTALGRSSSNTNKEGNGGVSLKEDGKGRKKKKKRSSNSESEQDAEDPGKASVVEQPSAGLGSGPVGGEVEEAVAEVVAVVDQVVTNTGFEEKTLEAVRQALAERPQHREGVMQRVKGVSAAGNNREEKVVNAIAGWNESITKAWRDTKCLKMAINPFAMYRGTAHLFWADFSGDWRMARFGSPKTRTWLLGDMHIYNMGAFLNSQEHVCYGLNDFDESVIGDYQYDVWRLAISLVLCARQNNSRKVGTAVQREIVHEFGEAYLDSVVRYERKEGGRTFTRSNTSNPLKAFLKQLHKSEDTTRETMLQKLCRKDAAGQYVSFDYDRQAAKPAEKQKLSPATPEEHKAVRAAFRQHYVASLMPAVRARVEESGWPDNVVLDVAHRVNSGLGSLGLPRFYVLLHPCTNMHGQGEEHLPIVLDVKLQGGGPRGRPTPFYFMDHTEKTEYETMFAHEGERHLRACQALTDATDPYLGYVKMAQGHFSVRERTPVKESYPALAEEAVKEFKELRLDEREEWMVMARAWGTILATLHAHAPHDFDAEMGRFHFRQEVDQLTRRFRPEFGDLLWQVSYGYALQVEQDYLYLKASRLVPDDSRNMKST